MEKQSDSVTYAAHSNTIQFDRFCAIIAILLFFVLFVWRTSYFYSNKFIQVKANIESYYASPPKEAFLKQLFLNYLTLTNRKNVNGVIIMNDGRLVFEKESNPPLLSERANVIIELKDYLQTKDIPFLFLRAPDSMRDNSLMPTGYENTVLEDGARFLSMLRDHGVDILDLREEMTNEYEDFAQTFFWGDHHWTAETALWAYGKVGTIMNAKYGFQLDEITWDPMQYEHISYIKTFVGSASSRVGNVKEDITVLIPKFHTEFIISNKVIDGSHPDEGKTLAHGSFIDVFTPVAKIQNNNSFSYLNLNVVGDGLIKQYKNLVEQEQKKALLISDSFSYPFVTYLATALESVDYLYLDSENQKLYTLLGNESYDVVMYLAYDGTILSGGSDIENDRMYIGEPR